MKVGAEFIFHSSLLAIDALGFSFLPSPISEGSQRILIRQILTDYARPLNRSNLDPHYSLPPQGLWSSCFATPDQAAQATARSLRDGSSIGAKDLLKRLRWITLGYHYNWDTKLYSKESYTPFPEDLAQVVSELVGVCIPSAVVPEAAIVNFYRPGDTLTAHSDYSEPNNAAPLVSIR